MKFFIDTADINEIRKANDYGILDGVTTNPTLVSKIGRPYNEVLLEIVKEFDVPVSTEVIGTECNTMVKEAHQFAKLGPNVVIKIPLIGEGLKAVKILTSESIKTNVTLCFSSLQALMAAKAGATYISPFVGRLDDINHDGMELIQEIVTIYNNYQFDTEVLVASIRHPLHIKTAALMGADVATIPFSVFEKIIKHPLTDRGVQQFIDDYDKIPQ